MELFTLQALWAFLAIILIDIVLAGDNALVIGMAANKLPDHLRKKAIFWGTFGAIAIRFVSVAALTYLLMIPGLRAIGAAALIWIGWKLVFDHGEHNIDAKDTFWGAIGTIVVADAVMGIDNALGIAAAANGNFVLVIAGLLVSVPRMSLFIKFELILVRMGSSFFQLPFVSAICTCLLVVCS